MRIWYTDLIDDWQCAYIEPVFGAQYNSEFKLLIATVNSEPFSRSKWSPVSRHWH